MKYILNDKGEPMLCDDIVTWANWFEAADRRVAITQVEGCIVSTAFLGIDYSFSGPPIVWETMVFKGEESLWFDRCGGSREQAEAMHDRMCRKILDRRRHLSSRIVYFYRRRRSNGL